MAEVLVTGGAGFIGFHLVKHLLQEGHQVTVLDNLFRSRLDEDFNEYAENIQFLQADLTQPLDTLPLRDRYDHVFHLAAINGVKYANNMPDVVLRTNLLATINVLDWCIKHKPETVVFASSSETYHGSLEWFDLPLPTTEQVPLVISDPNVPRYSYAGTKIIGELLTLNYAKVHGFKARIVRYHNIYGPRMGYDHVVPELITRIQQGETPFKLYGADQTRAFCYVTDAVEATYGIGVLKSEEHYIVNVGNSKEETVIRDLGKQLFALARYEAPVEEVAAPPGSPNRRCPDTSLLKELINYEPKVSLAEGLKETYAWYDKKAIVKA